MVGIDFVDTIVVRQSIEKGTKIIETPIKKLNWAGVEFKKYETESRKLAGDIGLASSRGTGLVHLGKLAETEIPSLKGLHISTGRGTGLKIG